MPETLKYEQDEFRNEGIWRQGLKQVARKAGRAIPAWCGGDFRSPRKPAGNGFWQLRTTAESPQPPRKK